MAGREIPKKHKWVTCSLMLGWRSERASMASCNTEEDERNGGERVEAGTPGRPRTDNADAEERNEKHLEILLVLFCFLFFFFTFCVIGFRFGFKFWFNCWIKIQSLNLLKQESTPKTNELHVDVEYYQSRRFPLYNILCIAINVARSAGDEDKKGSFPIQRREERQVNLNLQDCTVKNWNVGLLTFTQGHFSPLTAFCVI